jgi:cystathionine gamma-synthase
VSIRGAEVLLKDAEGIREVEFKTAEEPPEPTWTPESPAHAELRERVCSLLHRAARDPEQIKCTPGDVYLYPSGMGAVWYTSNILLEHRPGTALILGVIFHNTHHHLLEESPHGFKHHGVVDEKGLDDLEVWLDGEAAAERPVSYAYVEVPGNPTLDTPNMARLKKLSEKHGFVLIVDETVGSSANVDVLAYSDLLLTSLTKSFSGLSDVMAGSVVLNPLSPHYAALSALWPTRHRNEFFSADAEALLANSRGVLDRVPILDRNARAMAEFLAAEAASSEGSPIANVQYPSLLPTRGNFDALLRRGTPELPQPGYGCLLTVNFRSLEAARAFYDNTGFYATPHLGGHVTLNFPYNMLVFGKDPVEREYMTGLGVQEASVRISAGLEDEGDLIDTLKNMLEFAKEAHAKREKNQV